MDSATLLAKILKPIDGEILQDRIVVIKEMHIVPRYRNLRDRICRCTGGFGSYPNTVGKAVFLQELHEPFRTDRWGREDIEGWLTDEDYAKLTLDILSITTENTQ